MDNRKKSIRYKCDTMTSSNIHVIEISERKKIIIERQYWQIYD